MAVQGLVNTYSLDGDDELLSDPESARRWLVAVELGAPGIEVSTADLELLIELRELMRGMLAANHDRDSPTADGEQLARFAASHPVSLVPDGAGGLQVDTSPAASVDGLISRMLGIIQRSQLTAEWERLKICASDECGWAFFDTSRNRGGTWCSMDVCGNKIKNRTYRQRRAKT